MQVSDSLVDPSGGFVGRISVYWAQTELLLHGVSDLGHIARVRIPDNPFIALSLTQIEEKVSVIQVRVNLKQRKLD